MASLQIDPTGNYHLKFRFAGKQYWRSLETRVARKADAAVRVVENVRFVKQVPIGSGRLETRYGFFSFAPDTDRW